MEVWYRAGISSEIIPIVITKQTKLFCNFTMVNADGIKQIAQ